ALEVAVILVPERPQTLHLLGEPVPRRCRPDRDAGLLLLGQNDALSKLRPELCRDRQSVLRVQRVLVLPEKRQATVSLRNEIPALRNEIPASKKRNSGSAEGP